MRLATSCRTPESHLVWRQSPSCGRPASGGGRFLAGGGVTRVPEDNTSESAASCPAHSRLRRILCELFLWRTINFQLVSDWNCLMKSLLVRDLGYGKMLWMNALTSNFIRFISLLLERLRSNSAACNKSSLQEGLNCFTEVWIQFCAQAEVSAPVQPFNTLYQWEKLNITTTTGLVQDCRGAELMNWWTWCDIIESL